MSVFDQYLTNPPKPARSAQTPIARRFPSAGSTPVPDIGSRQKADWLKGVAAANITYRKGFDYGETGNGMLSNPNTNPINTPVGQIAAAQDYDAKVARNLHKIVPPSATPYSALTKMAERFVGSALSGAVGGFSSELFPQTTSELNKQTSTGNKWMDAAVTGLGSTAGMLGAFAVAPELPIAGGIASTAVRYGKGEESGAAALAETALNVGTLGAFSKLGAIKSTLGRIVAGAGISAASDIAGKGIHGELPTGEDIPGMVASAVIGGAFGLVGGAHEDPVAAKSFNEGVQHHADVMEAAAPSEAQIGSQSTEPPATPNAAEPAPVEPSAEPSQPEISVNAGTKPDEAPVETQRAAETTTPDENGTIQSTADRGPERSDDHTQYESMPSGVARDGQDRQLDSEGRIPRAPDRESDRGDESLRQGEARTDESGAPREEPAGNPEATPAREFAHDLGSSVLVGDPEGFVGSTPGRVEDREAARSGAHFYKMLGDDRWYPESHIQPHEEVPYKAEERPLTREEIIRDIQPQSAREATLQLLAQGGGFHNNDVRGVIGSNLKIGIGRKFDYDYSFLSNNPANKRAMHSPNGIPVDRWVHEGIPEALGLYGGGVGTEMPETARGAMHRELDWTQDVHDVIGEVRSKKHAGDILEQEYRSKYENPEAEYGPIPTEEANAPVATEDVPRGTSEPESKVATPPEAEPPRNEQPPPEPPEDREFGIRHESIDVERERYGLPARKKRAVYTDEQAKSDAAAVMQERPTEGARLFDRYAKEGSGAPSKLEYAVMLHEGALRAKDVERALDDIYLKNHGGSDRDIGELQEAHRAAQQRFNDAADVLDKSGSVSGQSLQARKLRASVESLTSANITRQWEAAKGSALTEEESVRAKDISDLAARAEEQSGAVHAERTAFREEEFRAAVEREVRSRLEDATFEKALEEAKIAGKRFGEDVGKSVAENARKGGSLKDLAARWHQEAQAAGVKGYTANLGFSSHAIEAFVKDGAAYILDGVTKLEEWRKALVKNLSDLEREHIQPHLNAIFDRSKKLADFAASQHVAPSKVTDELTAKNIRALYRKFYNEQPVAGDITADDAKELNARVTTFLERSHPNVTEDQVRDLFSGYGKPVAVSRKDDIRKLSQVRSINQKLAGIQSVEHGEVPSRSGRGRQKPTQAIRELGRRLNKALQESGLETVDPEKELASWQQQRTTALSNQIEDIEKELATGVASVRGNGTPREKTPEIRQLEATLASLKEQRDAQFPEIGQQQIVDAYIKHAKIAELQYRKRIAENDYGKRERVERELTAKEFEARDLKIAARIAFEKGRAEFEESAKTGTQKFFDKVLHVRRQSAVSGVKTLGRIFGADVVQQFLMTPTSMLIARVAPGLQGSYPLGFKEWMAINHNIVDHGYEEILKVWHNEASAMDESGAEKPGAVFKLHKMEKAPLFRAYRDVWRDVLMKKAQADGRDIGNPNVIEELNKQAHYEAQHIITMQASFMAKCFNGAISLADNIKVEPGGIPVGKAAAYTLRLAQPVVRVGANLAKWAFESTPQGMLVTLGKYGYYAQKAKRAGSVIDPVIGRAIVRGLALGSIGTIATVAGFVNHHNAGGLYVQGHQPPDGLAAEDIRELGPASILLTHTALGVNYQYGALLGQLHDRAISRGDDNLMRNTQDFLAATMALTNKYPGTELVGIANDALHGGNIGRAIVRQASAGSVKTVLNWMGLSKKPHASSASHHFAPKPY